MVHSDGVIEEMSALPGGATSGYGSIYPSHSHNVSAPSVDGEKGNIRPQASDETNGEDEWAQVRKDYSSKQSGLGGAFAAAKNVAQRIPPKAGLAIVALLLALLVGGVLLTVGGGGETTPPYGRQPLPPPALPLNQLPGLQKMAPPPVAAHTLAAAHAAAGAAAKASPMEAKRKAEARAAQVAQAQLAAERTKDAQQAQERADIAELLAFRPSDSPPIRASVAGARQRQEVLTYDEQRATVAQNNLAPLKQTVAGQQAQFSAENAEYEAFKNKLLKDQQVLTQVLGSKAKISERLAQLKILGRRESATMPGFQMKETSAEESEEKALQESTRYSNLQNQAGAQLIQTMRAEQEDAAEVKRERGTVSAQQHTAAMSAKQAQGLNVKTSGVQNLIAHLSPLVENLKAQYETTERSLVEDGLLAQDERRERARTALNGFIRRRERTEQLPVTPANKALIASMTKSMNEAQKHLGDLYSNEESDKEKLEAKVKAKVREAPLYKQFAAKHKVLEGEKAKLSDLSTQAAEMRAASQAAVDSAAAAEESASSRQQQHTLLSASERRLRIKATMYGKVARVQKANAKIWATKVTAAAHTITASKAQLNRETMAGEEYLENAMTGQQKRKALETNVANENEAFEQERMLREADLRNFQQAQLQLEAAQAVVTNLEEEAHLAKAEAWKADLAVKESRQAQLAQQGYAPASAGTATPWINPVKPLYFPSPPMPTAPEGALAHTAIQALPSGLTMEAHNPALPLPRYARPMTTDQEMAEARLQKALASGASDTQGVGRTLSSQWHGGTAPPLSPEGPYTYPAPLPSQGPAASYVYQQPAPQMLPLPRGRAA